jgi:hypothetical protein
MQICFGWVDFGLFLIVAIPQPIGRDGLLTPFAHPNLCSSSNILKSVKKGSKRSLAYYCQWYSECNLPLKADLQRKLKSHRLKFENRHSVKFGFVLLEWRQCGQSTVFDLDYCRDCDTYIIDTMYQKQTLMILQDRLVLAY